MIIVCWVGISPRYIASAHIYFQSRGRPAEFCVIFYYFCQFQSKYLIPQHLVNFSCVLSCLLPKHKFFTHLPPRQNKSLIPGFFFPPFPAWSKRNLCAGYVSSQCGESFPSQTFSLQSVSHVWSERRMSNAFSTCLFLFLFFLIHI